MSPKLTVIAGMTHTHNAVGQTHSLFLAFSETMLTLGSGDIILAPVDIMDSVLILKFYTMKLYLIFA